MKRTFRYLATAAITAGGPPFTPFYVGTAVKNFFFIGHRLP